MFGINYTNCHIVSFTGQLAKQGVLQSQNVHLDRMCSQTKTILQIIIEIQ